MGVQSSPSLTTRWIRKFHGRNHCIAVAYAVGGKREELQCSLAVTPPLSSPGASKGCTPLLLTSPSCCHLLLQPTRLLAVVIAKNTVGSSWRKVLGTRCGVAVQQHLLACPTSATQLTHGKIPALRRTFSTCSPPAHHRDHMYVHPSLALENAAPAAAMAPTSTATSCGLLFFSLPASACSPVLWHAFCPRPCLPDCPWPPLPAPQGVEPCA